MTNNKSFRKIYDLKILNSPIYPLKALNSFFFKWCEFYAIQTYVYEILLSKKKVSHMKKKKSNLTLSILK